MRQEQGPFTPGLRRLYQRTQSDAVKYQVSLDWVRAKRESLEQPLVGGLRALVVGYKDIVKNGNIIRERLEAAQHHLGVLETVGTLEARGNAFYAWFDTWDAVIVTDDGGGNDGDGIELNLGFQAGLQTRLYAARVNGMALDQNDAAWLGNTYGWIVEEVLEEQILIRMRMSQFAGRWPKNLSFH